MNENKDTVNNGLGGSNKRDNIILVGMTGCGKTTLARSFSALYGWGYSDLDESIERAEKKSVMRSSR